MLTRRDRVFRILRLSCTCTVFGRGFVTQVAPLGAAAGGALDTVDIHRLQRGVELEAACDVRHCSAAHDVRGGEGGATGGG